MRTLDFLAGAVVLPLLGVPLAVLMALGLRFDIEKTLVVGRGARLFWRRRLVVKQGQYARGRKRLALAHILDGVALLRGQLALVGPRPLAPLAPHAVASYRIALRPGLASPFVFGHWDQFGFETEDAVDFDYTTNRSWRHDVSILAHVVSAWVHEVAHASQALPGSK